MGRAITFQREIRKSFSVTQQEINIPWVKRWHSITVFPENITSRTMYKTVYKPVEDWKKSESQRIDAFQLWCCRRLLRVPWTARSNQSILQGNQSWIFIERTDAEAPTLQPPDAKSQLIGKDPDAGKDWGQEKGMTGDEMVGRHHWLSRHEFEQTLGDSEGQGSLPCCSLWGHKE